MNVKGEIAEGEQQRNEEKEEILRLLRGWPSDGQGRTTPAKSMKGKRSQRKKVRRRSWWHKSVEQEERKSREEKGTS